MNHKTNKYEETLQIELLKGSVSMNNILKDGGEEERELLIELPQASPSN